MKIIDKLFDWNCKQEDSIYKIFGKNKYYIPGGKRVYDETDEQALSRNKRRT
jgi:hypothetical protein